MTTFNELVQQYTPYYGTLVLDALNEISELIEIVEEPEDFFYRLFSLKRGMHLSSCVGWIFPLKGRLPDNEYAALRSMFDYNDWRKTATDSR